MFLAKFLRTVATVVLAALMAVVTDYVVNIVILKRAEVFTPWMTMTIVVIVGGPLFYFLHSQRLNLRAAKLDLSHSLKIQRQTAEEAERRRCEAERALSRLREHESLYRILANNLTDALLMWWSDGRRRYNSPAIEQLTGYTPAEFLVAPNLLGVSEEDGAKAVAAVRSLKGPTDSRTLEYRFRRKDGRVIWVESTYSLVPQEEGGGFIATSRDITERKRLAEELARVAAEAQAAAAAKADFLANMTHELRTPLTAIIGFSGLLRQSSALAETDARQVRLIHEASNTLLGVINDVLDFSRLEAGLEFDAEPFKPCDIARSAAALIESQAQAKGLSVLIEFGPGLKPLLGDAARLSQVMLNFLSNAVKFTSEGQIVISVEQAPTAVGQRLRMAVRDSGIGLPDDMHEAVFERFIQADAGVARRFGGTGLGLAICKRIIEAMDGRIGVESAPGRGSTFWFEVELPITETVANDLPATPQPAALERSVRLLLVEDNAANRELIGALLAPFEVEVEMAVDGVAAVDAFKAGKAYDLVLMDVQMPVMDGLTATRRIRALEPMGVRTPIVAMTANVLPDQIATCMAAGMDDHLGKPISPGKLLEAVARWSRAEAA
ncbi:hybrid sensor histidine kinase/response regulator [Caulobacter flavus]|uniref:histidine kinase n=2 Tax=Caulobacter flavus TaxID=1679497 RepID=A0A2N5CXJ6_9CAUL|nr:hybrid sensor histidine kinase/response regulator [Caulobacter flavus]PLR18537.1 hybrid sensor histidine kinase/response regulator [Caulobacter flavus]